MFQRWDDVTVSDELFGTYRAAQQVLRGIEQWPPFGLESDIPFLAVSFGMSKAGIDQIIERESPSPIFEGMSPGFSRRNDAQMLSKMSGVESHSGTASS